MFACLSSFKQEHNTEWNSPKLRKLKKEIKRVYSTVITVYVYLYIVYSNLFHDIPCNYLYVGWRESDQQYMVFDPQCALHACHVFIVSSWPRLQNGDKMLCVEPLDRM